MTDLVILKLGQTPSDPVAWAVFAGGNLVEAGRVASVAALGGIERRFDPDARVAAILPGEQVALREMSSPPKSNAKLRAAALLLFEDELAEPVEEVQVAIARSGADARAYAVSKAVLKGWLDALDAASVVVTEMTVDFACLGASGSVCVFVEKKDRIIASRGGAAFAAERALAEVIGPPFAGGAKDAAFIAYGSHKIVSGFVDVPIELRAFRHESDMVTVFGVNLSTAKDIPNFMTGDFRRKSARNFDFSLYRRAAMLAAGLAAALVFAGAAGGLRDARVAARFETAAMSLHKAAFPTYDGADIKAHARSMLAEGAKSASFLELSGQLAAGIETSEEVSLDRLRYDSARGQFVFSIKSNTDAGIENFRTALDANGLVALDNGGVRRTGDTLVSEMTARPK